MSAKYIISAFYWFIMTLDYVSMMSVMRSDMTLIQFTFLNVVV